MLLTGIEHLVHVPHLPIKTTWIQSSDKNIIQTYDPKLRLVCKQLQTTKSKIFLIEFLYLFLCILTTNEEFEEKWKKKQKHSANFFYYFELDR